MPLRARCQYTPFSYPALLAYLLSLFGLLNTYAGPFDPYNFRRRGYYYSFTPLLTMTFTRDSLDRRLRYITGIRTLYGWWSFAYSETYNNSPIKLGFIFQQKVDHSFEFYARN